MDKNEFLECLDELLELPPGTVAAGDALERHGWSSVAVIGFLALADEKFGEAPSPALLAKCRTADDLAALFPGRIAP
jgi:acyl carrier protein